MDGGEMMMSASKRSTLTVDELSKEITDIFAHQGILGAAQKAVTKWLADYNDQPLPFPVNRNRGSNDEVERLVLASALHDCVCRSTGPVVSTYSDILEAHMAGTWQYNRLVARIESLESSDLPHLRQCLQAVALSSSARQLKINTVAEDIKLVAPSNLSGAPWDPAFMYQREGSKGWRIRFDGGKSIFLPDTKGLALISSLIQHRNALIPAWRLEAMADLGGADKSRLIVGDSQLKADDEDFPYSMTPQGPMLNADCGQVITEDVRSLSQMKIVQYQTELVREENGQKRRWLEDQIGTLTGYLQSATTIHGKDRMLGSEPDKARGRVTKAITAALDKIQRENEDLWRHLQGAIQTGYNCAYRPERNYDWTF